MGRRRIVLLVVVAVAVGACSSSSASEAATEEAIRNYFDAWNTRDVDLIMSYVADDAELEFDPAGVFWTDPGGIRGAFEPMFARSEWTISVSDFEVEGDSATYNYEILSPDGTVLERGRSRAVVEDGLITSERAVGAYRS